MYLATINNCIHSSDNVNPPLDFSSTALGSEGTFFSFGDLPVRTNF